MWCLDKYAISKRTSSIIALALLISLIAIMIWSFIHPDNYIVWFFEVFPAVVALPILVATYFRFRFTLMVYFLVWIHCIILFIGGHYTYAEVPLFNDIKKYFGHERNNYDKVGHFAQGFIPAIVVRELLIRTSPMHAGKWLVAVVLFIVLGISAFYEIIEWWAAAIQGKTPDTFLGSQGDVWDAQKDMLCALVGAIFALVLLSKLHNWALRRHGPFLQKTTSFLPQTNKNVGPNPKEMEKLEGIEQD